MRKFLLGVVLVFATIFTNVWAEDNPKAVIIFDASGSMWGQINSVTKIEIARDALKNVVREWNPSVELGLTVYGHRSKGDCNDIETVIPVGKINKNRVVSTVMAIKPKGKTPISRSLRKVADEIKYTEEKATIILISDGKETCDPDPCGTAKELEKQGIDFVTHVIGFNVDKKTSQQLECIADATGGEYFSAKNATALNKAMKVIAKKVEVVEPKPIQKPKVKILDHTLEVTASEKEGGKWIGAYNAIYQMEDGKEGERVATAHSYKKKAGTKQLPVGKYLLKSTYNAFKKETPFEIKAGEVTKVNVVFGQTGTVEVTASETEGGKWIKATHYIYQDEEGKAGDRTGDAHSGKKESGKDTLPVGKYIIKSSYNAFKKETPFEIKAGEVTKLHVLFGQFFIEAKCIDMNANISYEVYANSGRLVFDKKIKCSESLTLVLDNGDYSVEAKVGSDIKTVKFTVGGANSKLLVDMTDIKKEPTKEDLIKADSQDTPIVEEVRNETSHNVNNAVESKTQIPNANTLEKDVNEVKKSLAGLGALFGGAGGVQKSIESKPMQGIKESLIVALPYMEKTKECYGLAGTLEDAKLCDVIANEGAKVAQEKMQSIVGVQGKMAKTIAHTEWSEEIRVKEHAREEKDIKDAKLYIICIDKGIGMGQLKECAANNGEFTPKKTEVEQLGDMLKMFGGMK